MREFPARLVCVAQPKPIDGGRRRRSCIYAFLAYHVGMGSDPTRPHQPETRREERERKEGCQFRVPKREDSCGSCRPATFDSDPVTLHIISFIPFLSSARQLVMANGSPARPGPSTKRPGSYKLQVGKTRNYLRAVPRQPTG